MSRTANEAPLVRQAATMECTIETYNVDLQRQPRADAPPVETYVKEPSRFLQVLLRALSAWPV